MAKTAKEIEQLRERMEYLGKQPAGNGNVGKFEAAQRAYERARDGKD